ncbi:hypothetical protein OB2597_07490 [Pseudooceanicola batsensis HTCC2597]|uniref:DUF4440 domain-containing protein n=1 Tax=Pseudooceanicola batsensis (strain ATCC BAA-863 / DSM 15984 / KCTC 12145 / HTCC2597) TaxID=252305 RepID=A3TTY3_PSEBH|nr:nuclear transport factor 2 family protein [Pseudooceanicola batsensis]EAQ05110.1 hypothetical protein OB2597_07490 [Pseudooceanicola batsensis HTCC2597]
MPEPDIWETEKLLWTGGTDAYRRRLGASCLMAFPGMGILQGEEILDAIADAPRWSEVDFVGKRVIETNGLTVLAYRAHALRDGDAPYDALCSSTWQHTAEGWRIVQHQQSPLHA